MKNNIYYKIGNEMMIDDVEDLWNALNQIHFEKSPDFKSHHKSWTFCDRKRLFLSQASIGELFIIIAYKKNTKIGYCVSSLVNAIGEIESIYVKSEYRHSHIGSTLIEKSLDWINSHNVERISVKVAAGNEEVFGFYSKYGFKPRLIELQTVSLQNKTSSP